MRRTGVLFPLILLDCVAVTGAAADAQAMPIPDWRHRLNGTPIPGGEYCDQPYVDTIADGGWLC